MQYREHSIDHSGRAVILVALVPVVAALYLARDVLIPFTLAILFMFLLQPLVVRLKRWGMGHITAVAVVGAGAVVVLGIVVALVSVQVIGLVEHLPTYAANAQEKLRFIVDPLKSMAAQATDGMEALTTSTPEPSAAPMFPALITTQVQEEGPEAKDLFGAMTFIFGPIGMLAIVTMLTGAMLLQGSDLRDRLVRLIGDNRSSVTSKALDDVSERVGRYLVMQTLINGAGGVVIALGLFLLGVPGAWVWGLLWGALRFLPYIGPWLGALMPIIVSLGQSSGWTQPALVISLFVIVELITNMIIEPWLYGSGTGLSPLAVIASAVFWAWLWGWAGLLLATPMTVCLAVLGRYVPRLEFLHVLLGDKAVLSPCARLYQRLLTGQTDEARATLAAELETRPAGEVLERVLVPALARIDDDVRDGNFQPEKARELWTLLEQAIESLPLAAATSAEPIGTCLCLPARDQADVLCSQMLRRIFAARGIELEIFDAGYLASEKADLVAERKPPVVLISALGTTREPYLRHALRRIAAKAENTVLVAALWGTRESDDELQSRVGDSSGALIVTTVADAFDAVRLALPARAPLARRETRASDAAGPGSAEDSPTAVAPALALGA